MNPYKFNKISCFAFCILLGLIISNGHAQTAPTGPPAMPTISGPSAVTQPTGTPYYTASASATTGTSYQWSLSNSAAGSTKGNTATGTLQWTSSFTGNVQVQCIAYNSYGLSATASYNSTVTVAPPALNPSVIGPSGQTIDYYTTATLTGTASTCDTGNIDELRLYPSTAQMTTFTYDTLVGVTASTNAKNETTLYEYDCLQRLMNIKATNGNIIKALRLSLPKTINLNTL